MHPYHDVAGLNTLEGFWASNATHGGLFAIFSTNGSVSEWVEVIGHFLLEKVIFLKEGKVHVVVLMLI